MNEEEEKQLLGSRLFDQIDAGLHSFGKAVASAAEDKEGWTDDAVRGTLGTLEWIGNLPVLKQLGQLEEGLVSGVRNLAERQDFIDPRAFTYTTRVGTAFIPYGGAVKALSKTKKVGNVAKVAKTAKTTKFVSGATDDLMRQQAGLRMRLLQSIDPLDSDDALMRRYTEINNPDSYVTDKFSPDYGRLKSDVTFNPRQQLELAIEIPDPITTRNMMKRALDNNLITDGRLNYRAFLESNRFAPGYRRLIAGDYVTPPSKGLPYAKLTRRTQYQSRVTAFNNYRQELLDEFKAIFGDDFSRLPFNESQLDLDHKLTLVQSLGMLHNTAPGDKLWKRITEYALKRGYTPGDAKPNLSLLDPESHRVKTNFFNDLHGLREGNLKYWNGKHRKTNKTRYEIMSESHLSDEAADLHMEVVKDYFDVVDRGDKILRDAQAIFKAEYKLNILPEEIAEELIPVILSRQYSPKNVQNAIKDIIQRNKTNFRNLEEQVDLLEFIEDYENFPKSPLTRQEYQQIDPQDVIDAKKQLAKLRRVTNRKSYIQRLLEQRERARLKSIKADEASGQLRLPIDE